MDRHDGYLLEIHTSKTGFLMAPQDSRGLALSTVSERAAQAYRDGVDLMMSAWPGAAESLEQAIAADDGFALAHAALARLHAMRMQPAEARGCIARAGAAVARRGTARERSHVATLALAIGGQGAKALESVLAHLDDWPRDALILALPLGAFGLYAFSGMADHDQARVALCERVAGGFAEDDWWFLASHGWSLVENGAVERGRAMVERALRIRAANANGMHALAHALFEQGAGAEADTALAAWLPGYDRAGLLHGHLAWHQALAALDQGDADRALAIYGQHVSPDVSLGAPLNIVSDAASLLWRLQLYGHAVPAADWQRAKAYGMSAYPQAGFAFADVHLGLLDAATADGAAAATRIAALDSLVAEGRLAAGSVVPAILRAAQAFTDGDPAGCARILEPMLGQVARIGGSGAQREIVEDTLIVALMRSGDTAKARSLLDRRLHRRPSARDLLWRKQISA